MMSTIQRAYKTELDPNETQQAAFRRYSGSARFVWNKALALRKKLWRQDGLHIRAYTLNKLLTKWKAQNEWLAETPTRTLQEALREQDAAYAKFFDTCAKIQAGDPATLQARAEAKRRKDDAPFGFPRFRRRFDPCHFTLRTGIRVTGGRVQLPGSRKGGRLSPVRVHEQSYLPEGEYKVATISQRAGRWFISLQVEEEWSAGEATGPAVGVDLGLTDLACASDGRRWEGPKALAAAQRKLAHVQRKHARQVKGSGRRRDTTARIARLHAEVANIRGNALHELTSELVGVGLPAAERPRAIVIEDLRVANMLQNGSLARCISDAAWAEIRRQLAYKCEWWGVELIVVNPAYTSQTCSRCGHVSADSREGKRFCCVACDHRADADMNAARNILARGLLAGKAPESQNARGGHRKPSQRIAAQGSVKRESGTLPVASGATPDHSTVLGGA